MTKLWVSAIIELEEKADLKETEAALAALVPPTLQEPGCFLFEIRQWIENPRRFTLWECWAGEEGLASHLAASYVVDYMARGLTRLVSYDKLMPLGSSGASSES